MERVIEYLESLPEKSWKTQVNSEWKVRDVVAHLIGWNKEAAKVIPDAIELGKDPWFLTVKNFDEYNARWVSWYEKFSPGELIAELKKSEKQLRELIDSYGEENLSKRPGFKWLFDSDGQPHSHRHLEEIKKALESQKN